MTLPRQGAALLMRFVRSAPERRRIAALLYPTNSASAWTIRIKRAYFELDVALNFPAFCRLEDFFYDPAHPQRRAVVGSYPLVFQKIRWAYSCRGLSIAQQVDRVLEHYQLAETSFGPRLFDAIFTAPERFLLCQVALPKGAGSLPVYLWPMSRFHREGEMTLALYDPFGTLLYSATLALRRSATGVGVFIGCINGTAPRDVVKHITKLMQGLRPQNLVMFLVQAFCRHFGYDELIAVGRLAHAYAGTDNEERLKFDYDGFWRELGGEELPERYPLFKLPLLSERRSEDQMPPQKRAQYRRRYEFMDEVEADLHARLSAQQVGLALPLVQAAAA